MRPSPDTSPRIAHRRWKQRVLFLGLFVAAIAVPGMLAAARLGNWLVVQDPLQSVSAIVVLGGQVPFRAMEAAAIYRQGWAREVWLTRHAVHPEDIALTRLGIPAVTEDTLSQQVLEKLGVPAGAIRKLDQGVQNTADEVRLISQEMQKTSATRVIIVTSKFHTRRVKFIWHILNGDHITAVVRCTPYDPSDPDHWWRNTENAMAVSREVFGLMNAWAGFPMRSGGE